MEFRFSDTIDRHLTEVFAFLEDMRNHPQEEGSKVLLVEKTTPGLIGVGTRFREVVEMFPLIRVEMVSEVTRYQQNALIEFTWRGGGLEGVLSYSFEAHAGVTGLTLHETVTPIGLMSLLEPVIRQTFQRILANRLKGIKRVLEQQNSGPEDRKSEEGS